VIEEVENIEFKLTSIVYSKIDSTANMPKKTLFTENKYLNSA